jgi:DNA-binding PadR family transcriptional regulator
MPNLHELPEILPLSESTFFILLSLAPAPKHGYAIMKDTRALSDGRVVLSTGTLYGALKRLLEQAWIRRVEDRGNGTARDRKAYALTNQGRRVLSAEIERLQKLVSTARLQTLKEKS